MVKKKLNIIWDDDAKYALKSISGAEVISVPLKKERNDAILMQQKLDYIHNNPVEERLVYGSEDYIYSNAIDYAVGTGLLDIKIIE